MGVKGIDPAFWRGRRVLTGHTGLKGSYRCGWLSLVLWSRVSPLSLTRWSHRLSLFTALGLADCLGARHLIGDIRHAAVVQTAVDVVQPEVVIHLAAQPLVRQSYMDPVDTWSTNVQGSLQLLESLRTLSSAVLRCWSPPTRSTPIGSGVGVSGRRSVGWP